MQTSLDDALVFLRVVEAGGFTAAGEVLGLPKSTVSRRVARLEDRLGARLLERTTRKLRLTDAGHTYFARCTRIAEELEAAERAVLDMQDAPRGRLRVTAPVELARDPLMPIVAAYLARYPEVELDLDLTGRFVDLVEEGFDLAVRAGPLRDSTLVARKLNETPQYLYGSPEYIRQRGEPERFEDLEHHDLVLLGTTGATAQLSVQVRGRMRSVRGRCRLAVNNFDLVKDALLGGLGVGPLPDLLCTEEVRRGALMRLLPDLTLKRDILYAVYPSARHLAPKVRAFVDLLREHFGRTTGAD